MDVIDWLEQRLLAISPFRADIERRERQEQEARNMIAAAWPIADADARLPYIEYPKRLLAESTLDGLGRRLAFDWITRELVFRDEQRHVWNLDVADIQHIAASFPNGLPTSGDDRPGIRRGRMRP